MKKRNALAFGIITLKHEWGVHAAKIASNRKRKHVL